MDKDIMKITVENLIEKQYEFIKTHTINTLLEIVKHIENEEFDKIEKLLAFSQANSTYYINFAYDDDDTLDIKGVINLLENLKFMIDYNNAK